MKVSIVTVSYNSESTIRETIESVLSQSYRDIEYIVVDGGSTDETMSIVDEYSDCISMIVSEKDEGIYDAMNKGVKLATGEWVGILNSDDCYPHDQVIGEVVGFSTSDPSIDALLGDVEFFNTVNPERIVRKYRAGFYQPWMLRFGFAAPHPAAFFKKEIYNKIGCYKLGYGISADFDFFVRFFCFKGGRYKKVNKTWVMMRIGGVSTSGIKSYLVSNREILRSLRENGIYSNALFVMLRLPIKFLQRFV